MFDRSTRFRLNRPGRVLAALLGLALLAACTQQTVLPAPTQPPPGLAVDLRATAAALDAAGTQVVNSQATLIAQARNLSATEAVQATRAAALAAATAPAGGAVTPSAQAPGPAGTPTAQAAGTAAPHGGATPAATAVTPAASATPTREFAPTQPPRPTSSAACTSVNPALAPVADAAASAGLNLGCPMAPAATVQGAVQEYWAKVQDPDPAAHLRSLLVWRGDNREIYVLRGADTEARQGRFSTYLDRWEEGDPSIAPACAALPVPGGYQMPIRGFGKLWCAAGLDGAIGWPNRQEVAAGLLVQPTRAGVLLQVSAPDAGLGYLVALDYASGRALTRAVTP